MKKLLILPLLAVAVMMASCSENKGNTYTTDSICTFDYSDADEIAGDDKVYFGGTFIGGGLVGFLNTSGDDGKVFIGGCALVGLADKTLEEGHIAKDLCVYGKGYDNTPYYVTVKYNPGKMPEHLLVFTQKGYGTLNFKKVYVNNTNKMVTIAHYGLPKTEDTEAIPAFQDGDYVRVKFTSNSAAEVEFTLAERNNGTLTLIDDWKEIDLSKLGTINYVDVEITSNRTDLPLEFCLDNLYLSATINM